MLSAKLYSLETHVENHDLINKGFPIVVKLLEQLEAFNLPEFSHRHAVEGIVEDFVI